MRAAGLPAGLWTGLPEVEAAEDVGSESPGKAVDASNGLMGEVCSAG